MTACLLSVAAGGPGCSYDWSFTPPSDGGRAEASLEASAETGGDAHGDASLDATSDADAGSAYRATVLADHPVLYWRLGESGGSTAKDEVAEAGSASYGGSVTLGQKGALFDDPNTAVELDGLSGCINAGDVASFDGKKSFSLEAWVKPSVVDADYRRVFLRENGDGSEAYELIVHETYFVVERYVDGGLASIGKDSVTTKLYTHVVATYDGKGLALYANGVSSATKADSRSMGTLTSALYVGCRGSTSNTFLKGELDEVAVYDYALLPEQVLHHYDVGSGTGDP
jgi:trimeric autotransporter adhesin